MANATVTKDMTMAFARAWDMGGIKMILDNTSLQFATDWANIALRSALLDQNLRKTIFLEVLAEVKAAKDKTATPATPATPSPEPTASKPKSSIVLTDD